MKNNIIKDTMDETQIITFSYVLSLLSQLDKATVIKIIEKRLEELKNHDPEVTGE